MRKAQAEAGSLTDALRAVVADLVGATPEDVEVRVEAPGLATLSGGFRAVVEPLDDLPAEEAEEAEEADDGEEVGEDAAEFDEADDDRADDDDEDEDDDDDEVGEDDVVRRDRYTDEAEDVPPTAEELDAEADAAADFLEGLLDRLDLPGDLQIRVEDDHADIEIVDVGSGVLIGRRGQTLESVQELLRCVLQRRFERRSRVAVDVEGYRGRRLERLLEKAEEVVDEVLETGEAIRLEPMDAFERKAVHRFVSERDGVISRSQGREPGRRVVIEPE